MKLRRFCGRRRYGDVGPAWKKKPLVIDLTSISV